MMVTAGANPLRLPVGLDLEVGLRPETERERLRPGPTIATISMERARGIEFPDSELAREGRNSALIGACEGRVHCVPAPRQKEPPAESGQRSLAQKYREYQQVLGRVRDIVRRVTPFGATVAVVNKGDKALLELDGRHGWHFPRQDDGGYAGYHPASTDEVIARVEAVRAAGAAFLLFPASSFWWLEHYVGLREYLEGRYRTVTRQDDTCVIFALGDVDAESLAADGRGGGAGPKHRLFVDQLRQLVRSILPDDATVAVVSGGDAELLDLVAAQVWHFPCAGGAHADSYPADVTGAIAQVEAACAAGADYLLFPVSAFSWLERYAGLREYLERRWRLVTRQQHVCSIYALRDGPTFRQMIVAALVTLPAAGDSRRG